MRRKFSLCFFMITLLVTIMTWSNVGIVFGSEENIITEYPYVLADNEYLKIVVLGSGVNPYNDSWIGYRLELTNKQDYTIGFSSYAELTDDQQLGKGDTCYFDGELTKTHFGEMLNAGITYDKAVLAIDGVTDESQLINIKGYIVARNNQTGEILGQYPYVFNPQEESSGEEIMATEETEDASEEPTEEEDAKEQKASFQPIFSENDTREMSRFMCEGKYLYRDGELYGWYKQDGVNSLIVVTPETDGYHMDLKDGSVISEINASFLCQDEKYIYASWRSNENSDEGGILKVDPVSKDAQSIYDYPVDSLQNVDGKLYFTDTDAHFFCFDTVSNEITLIIDDTKVYIPYVVDGWVLFQDDPDGESLHIRHMESGEDHRISNPGLRVYRYIIADNKIFFTAERSDDSVLLGYIDMETWQNFFSEQTLEYVNLVIDGNYIFGYRAYGHLEDWDNLTYLGDDADYQSRYLCNDQIMVYWPDSSWVRVAPHYYPDESVGVETVSFRIN